jgi:hypothetical protein
MIGAKACPKTPSQWSGIWTLSRVSCNNLILAHGLLHGDPGEVCDLSLCGCVGELRVTLARVSSPSPAMKNHWLGCGYIIVQLPIRPEGLVLFHPRIFGSVFPIDSRRTQPPNAITILIAGVFSCRRLRAHAIGSSALPSAARDMSLNGNPGPFQHPDAGLAAASVPPGFPPTNFINPDTLGPRLINVNIAAAVITSVYLGLRLYTRIRLVRQPGLDDGMWAFQALGIGWWLILLGPVFIVLGWVIVLDERHWRSLLTQHRFLLLPRIFPPASVSDLASIS